MAPKAVIGGTFTGSFETPAGLIQQTGAKLDIPSIAGTCRDEEREESLQMSLDPAT